ncbi:MAG: hypothetical protein ACLVAU_13690 [Ruminococcus sp.]
MLQRSFGKCISTLEDKNRVMSISQDIDSCIARNADGYHYDLDSAYDELIENNTAFDIACTMALVVKAT